MFEMTWEVGALSILLGVTHEQMQMQVLQVLLADRG